MIYIYECIKYIKIYICNTQRHTGLLAILDEESNFPKATDKSLATKLHQNTGILLHMYILILFMIAVN
jgi:myosin heavy subunit